MFRASFVLTAVSYLASCSSASPRDASVASGGASAGTSHSAGGSSSQPSAVAGGAGQASGSDIAGQGQGGALGVGGGTSSGGAAGSLARGGSDAGGAATAAGGTDSGSAGASAGSCAGLFCEDFESGKIDPAIWDTKTFGGQTVAVQSSTVAHGKYAVQFHAAPNLVSYDFIITKNAPAALQRHHFGRASFLVTPKPPAQHTAFLFSGTAGFPNFKYLEVAATGATWQLSAVHLTVPSGKATSDPNNTQEVYHSGGTVPQGKWSCLEWEFNDEPDQSTVFVDGKQDVAFSGIDLNNLTTGAIGGFSAFGFGFYAWHPATYEFDVYFDDIVLDTSRINCPSP